MYISRKRFSDGIRVFMNGNRRTLPHGTTSSLLLTPGSRDTNHSVTVTTAGNTCVDLNILNTKC